MKIKSLLLGSAVAAGLSTGAFAADPMSVMSALNACDSLGISGITVASDDNCISITGEVKWEGSWGDYVGTTVAPSTTVSAAAAPAVPGPATITPVQPTANPTLTAVSGSATTTTITSAPAGAFTIITPGANPAGQRLDWSSKLEWFIRVKATADTANGPASAIVKLKQVDQWVTTNVNPVQGSDSPYDTDAWPEPGTGGDHTFGIIADEAYVSIGAANIWMIGKKGSIINKGDDESFGYKLFSEEKVDNGVFWSKTGGEIKDGGIVIQTTMDVGNGLFVSAGLENLQATGAMAGTAVGVLEYKGDGITAHATGVAAGFLDGVIERFAGHAGFTATFDVVTVRGAIAADDSGHYNGLIAAMATLDMFTIAVSAEAVTGGDFGVGGQVGATVADGIAINVGGRYYVDAGAGPDGYQGWISLAAAVTETVKLTAAIGVYGNDAGTTVPYGSLEAAYAPGGDFTASVKGEVNSLGAYKGTVKAGKKFQ